MDTVSEVVCAEYFSAPPLAASEKKKARGCVSHALVHTSTQCAHSAHTCVGEAVHQDSAVHGVKATLAAVKGQAVPSSMCLNS